MHIFFFRDMCSSKFWLQIRSLLSRVSYSKNTKKNRKTEIEYTFVTCVHARENKRRNKFVFKEIIARRKGIFLYENYDSYSFVFL